MIFPVNIEITKEGNCGETCMFKDTDLFGRAGTCLLFKETLVPEMEYGGVKDWIACIECRQATINKVDFEG